MKEKPLPKIKKRSVLFILPDLSGGGAERTVVDLLQYMNRDRFIPYLGLLSEEGEYLSLVNPVDIKTVTLPEWCQRALTLPGNSIHAVNLRQLVPRLLRIPASIYQIRDLVKTLQPDVLITSMTGLNVLTYIALGGYQRRRVRWIAREGNNFTTNLKSLVKNRLVRKLLLGLIRRSYHKADQVLTVSQGSAQEVAKGGQLNPAKITYIYNPINFKQIQPALRSAKSRLQQTDARPYLVAVGRLHRQKGFEYLLQALHICHHQYALKDLKLIILGEGDARVNLEAQVNDLNLQNHVELAGFVDNPWDYIAKAEAFVLSSLWEGFPHVVIEAMACHTPVISTNCDHGPKEIISSELMGVLVPTQNSQALADEIAHLITHPDYAAQLAHNAFKRVQDFEVTKITREYESLFEKVYQSPLV